MMSASRDRSIQLREPELRADKEEPPRDRGTFRFSLFLLVFVVPLAGCVVAAAETGEGRTITAAVQRFLLFYSGVFALVALTAAVGAGLVATDRIVMSPGRRIVLQAVHRAISLLALAALVTHVVLEIVAHKAHTIDAFVPFLAHGRTFYIGLGTIASDLVVVLIATGLLRRRFARGRAPWSWRLLHASAYLAWPLAIVHGLLAGRTAKPYVDWSYGACVAAVIVALLVRTAATRRVRPSSGRWPLRVSRASGESRAWAASRREGHELP
jgi:DMSO/TMAO reductase YedYZ heme-binding membrane subunit